MQTLTRNLQAFLVAKEHVSKAMCLETTAADCLAQLEAAMNAAQRKRSYLEREWKSTHKKRGMYAGQHSTLLQQVTTTGVVEAWHRRIKEGIYTKRKVSKQGFIAAVKRINKCAAEIDRNSEMTEMDFSTRQLVNVRKYSQFKQFPFLVQSLLVDELRLLKPM